MRRRLFTLASVVSLLFSSAALVLLIRSDDRRDEIRLRWHGKRYAIASERGQLLIDNAPEIDAFVARQRADTDAFLARRDNLSREWAQADKPEFWPPLAVGGEKGSETNAIRIARNSAPPRAL